MLLSNQIKAKFSPVHMSYHAKLLPEASSKARTCIKIVSADNAWSCWTTSER